MVPTFSIPQTHSHQFCLPPNDRPPHALLYYRHIFNSQPTLNQTDFPSLSPSNTLSNNSTSNTSLSLSLVDIGLLSAHHHHHGCHCLRLVSSCESLSSINPQNHIQHQTMTDINIFFKHSPKHSAVSLRPLSQPSRSMASFLFQRSSGLAHL